MGTVLNISAYSMNGVTMKWFDFDEILKCSGGKRLLKSYGENKLKTIKKTDFAYFFQISPYSYFLFTGNVQSELPVLLAFSGRLQKN